MKVLITGGYGFIGSHVAERFNKEGYEVFIIDNLSSGKETNIHFKHRGYHLSVEDPKCEEIFRRGPFDAVIHLAAQVSVAASVENPGQDATSNVLGLINMLNLAGKYKAKKFIFASSAAVYGTNEEVPLHESADCNPISPYGMSKWAGETYCRMWRDNYSLETLCFRFSNVYGPRQNCIGEGGVISIFANRVIAGDRLYVYGDGEQTRDFIYVEDIADAIFRASYSSLTGVYNLSTQTETSVNELIRLFDHLHESSSNVIYQGPREGDIKRSMLDNNRVKQDLDWSPMYDLSQGLTKTYEWFKQSFHELNRSEDDPPLWSRIQNYLHTAKPYIENLLLFILVVWLTLSQVDKAYSFIDFKMFYITIIGIIYGGRQSFIAVGASILLLLYEKLAGGFEFISIMYDTDMFFHIAIYFCVGFVVGLVIDRKNEKSVALNDEISQISEKYHFLNEVYQEVREVKDELKQRIMNNGDSLGKIYSITKELDSLEPDEIFVSTVHVIESIMDTKSVSIYIANGSRTYLRLVAHSLNNCDDRVKSLKVDDHEYVSQMFFDGNVFVNTGLEPKTPLMAAPVRMNGETVAIITLDDIPFEKFSLYYQNLFKITIDLVSSALSRAFSYIEATESLRFVDGTQILTRDVFEAIRKNKLTAKEKLNINYTIVTPEGPIESIKDYAVKIKRLLRETDYIGLGTQDELLILLSNTESSDVARILERFAKKGLHLKPLNEELSYA